MKDLKHIKRFNESQENLNISDVRSMLDEISNIEKNNKIFIRVKKSYSGGNLIELQGVIFKLKYIPLSRYQKYEEEYLYKGDVTYGFEKDEYLILKKTLDYYKNHILD
jgi:hypothetical protein